MKHNKTRMERVHKLWIIQRVSAGILLGLSIYSLHLVGIQIFNVPVAIVSAWLLCGRTLVME